MAFPEELMLEPYEVQVNGETINYNTILYDDAVYLYFTYSYDSGTITIKESEQSLERGGALRRPSIKVK